ncbi:MAG: mercuric transport protein MerTP [Chitinophagales bacterium]|nr:mercuric transport protein MerTP [Chitinophagales bacterium]
MNVKAKSDSGLLAGIIAAVAGSLCCIIPVIALIGGLAGAAASFSWIEPLRPYLISLTVLIFGFAWYQKLKPQPVDDCGCEVDEKPNFIQSKIFLGLITIFSVLMITFPYYSKIFFTDNAKLVVVADQSNIQTAEFKISGMSCSSCEQEVKHEVNKVNGLVKAEVSYEKAFAQIQFDNSKTNASEIEKAINSTGYQVTSSTIKK